MGVGVKEQDHGHGLSHVFERTCGFEMVWEMSSRCSCHPLKHIAAAYRG